MSQASAKEIPCPDCGEMVRVNSLRCWNCGAFMNADVEQKFMAMQANPSPIIFSEVPEAEMSSIDDAESLEPEGDDDDFQLSSSTKARPAAPQTQTPSAPAKPTDETAPESPASSTEEAGETEATDKKEKTPASDSDAGADEKAETEEKTGEEEPTKRRTDASESDVNHSEATGGDALLDIAMQEEREVKQRQKGRKVTGPVKTAGGGLIIYCPYGCRVEVKEQHRGMTGKCPRCGAPFIVPVDPPQFKKSKTEAATEASPSKERFKTWIHDLHLHVVEPEKLKLKADSLLKEFFEADLGFSSDQLLVAVLSKKVGSGGLFAKGGEKKETLRENLNTYLNEDKPLDGLPAADKFVFTSEELSDLRVVQPTANRGTSLFHGIPVFGAGRIAVQLPLTDKMEHPTYLSFGITEFWKFAKAMEEFYGIAGLGQAEGVPMEAKTSVHKCHYSEMLMKAIDDVEMFQADPTAELEIIGYTCGACKLAVSEAARKKENLGGKSPKGIAKAKCPKCGSKMGEHLLYALKEDANDPSMSGDAE